jgi:hypothetical protein
MKTFEQFVAASAEHGSINLDFESGMHMLVNDLEGVVNTLRDAGVPFEVVGGVAVNAHIFSRHRSRSFVTRDIDVLIHRSDLERVAKAAESLGYRAKKMMGAYTLIRPEQDLAEAVHLLSWASGQSRLSHSPPATPPGTEALVRYYDSSRTVERLASHEAEFSAAEGPDPSGNIG